MSKELSIREEHTDNSVNIFLSGELDIYSSQKLKEKLYDIIETADVDLRIDCADLTYIDSTGLGIFVGTLKRAKQQNKNIYLAHLRDNIEKLFVITGLDKVFIIEE